jgi:ATP-dependent Clp protease ATP-binding subunit ClpA
VFERFTDGSRRAVVLAQESAVDLRHDRITVEHLLLGVARADQGAGFVALADQGVTADRLRQAVRQVVPPGASAPAEHVPFTAAAKKAMEFSLEEAMRRGAAAIDNGHLLLALLRQGGDELPAVLSAVRLDVSALGPVVERRLAEAARDSPPRPSTGYRSAGTTRDSPQPPIDRDQLDRIEALLTAVLARLDRIEARLDQPGPT